MSMKTSWRFFCKLTNCDWKNVSLKGRNYITPSDLSPNEMKYLLMTALKLKTTEKTPLQFTGKNIIFLLDSPCLGLQACIYNTSNMLKMPLNILIDSGWETTLHPQDMGKLLSTASDIIFCKAHRQQRLKSFAKGSTVPVINVSSCRFTLLQILSNFLTLRQHFGTLDGLTIAWIGHACPLLNTYLRVGPTLNMQIKFLCRCGGPVSPSDIYDVLSKGETYVQKIKECSDLKETIEGAHVIVTTNHNENDLRLKLTDLKMYADKRWVFLHTLPRTFAEVEDEVFDSDRNLIWMSYMNYKWICAAIITRFIDLQFK